MAGLTFASVDQGEGYLGRYRWVIKDVTFDDNYPTGGEAIDLSGIGLSQLMGGLYFGAKDATSAGIVPVVIPSTRKLMAMRGNQSAHTHPLLLKNAAVADGATTRVNAGTNLLGANTGSDITVAGGGANGGVQANTAGDVAMSEVASTTNLSTVTVRMMFFG